ncbi:MAG: thioredoxin fold domain-containing protein [Cyanobacteria bacterium RM1_2_2]|nr:thioredoxin fold domain-containing protein [Cyanobacteria bacterium RM1_2_2]
MTVNSPTPTPNSPPTPESSSFVTRLRNFVVVLVAVVLAAAVFLGFQTGSDTGSLAAMAKAATPLEVALQNGKPTLMEFYADWCTSCQAMAKDMDDLRQEYNQQINFVMLNVDNAKWLPEMLHYRVEAIPHFTFLDQSGEPIATTIGEQPRSIMAANVEALVAATPLPYVQQRGRISQVEAPLAPSAKAGEDPRSHGAQVQPQS